MSEGERRRWKAPPVRQRVRYAGGLDPTVYPTCAVRMEGTRNGKTAITYEVEDYLLVGPRVWNLAFSPDRDRLFTTNGVSGDVSVIDLERRRVIKSVKVGRLPWGVVVAP